MAVFQLILDVRHVLDQYGARIVKCPKMVPAAVWSARGRVGAWKQARFGEFSASVGYYTREPILR